MIGIEFLIFIILGLLALMLFLGVPFAFSVGATAVVVGILKFGPNSLIIISNRIYEQVTNYALVSVPLFILMGLILNASGIPEAMFRGIRNLTRGVPGGLAIGTIVLSALLAAMVGVIGAEIVILGLIALPALLSLGYDRKISLGLICAGGSLGSLLPPSIVLILYGVFAQVSVSSLFVAAITPGFMLAGFYCLYVIVSTVLRERRLAETARPEPTHASGSTFLTDLASLVVPLALIATMIACLSYGVATPTELAALGLVLALIAAAANGKLTLSNLRLAAVQTGASVGKVIYMFFGASVLVSYFSLAGGTSYLQSLFVNLPLPPVLIILVMMLIWFVLGFVIDVIAIMFLTIPIFVPVAVALDYSPVWFGVLFCLNMQMSYLTPPFAPSAFYLRSVAPEDVTIEEIFRAVWPFVGLQLVALILVLLIPEISVWML